MLIIWKEVLVEHLADPAIAICKDTCAIYDSCT